MQRQNHLLVFGGGRMGLSHAAMVGLLQPETAITIVEPSPKARLLLRVMTGKGVSIVRELNAKLAQTITHAIVASPPKFHSSNTRQLSDLGFSGRLLIEKPVNVAVEDFGNLTELYHGYTLRYQYFWHHLVSYVREFQLKSLKIEMLTNQDFATAENSWRAKSDYDGEVFLNEYGSHLINFVIGLTPADGVTCRSAETNRIELQFSGPCPVNVEMKAAVDSVRKSTFFIEMSFDGFIVFTDFYSMTVTSCDGKVLKDLSLAGLGVAGSASLRGSEFSFQTEDFLEGKTHSKAEFLDAMQTDNFIFRIKEQLLCQS